MDTTQRADVLNILEQAAKQVAQVQSFLEGEESIATLHALDKARQMNRSAIAYLLAACLETLLDEAAKDANISQERLNELTVLMRFAWSALCPACRRLIGNELKKTNTTPLEIS